MRKYLFIMLFALLLLILPVTSSVIAADDKITVYFDASEISFDVQPQVINGRTMVPIRAIFEKMGAVVKWNEQNQTATCTKNGTTVEITVNNASMYINDELIQMDVSPVVVDGRTLAPARYVAEAFGFDVQWIEKSRSVVICSKDVNTHPDYSDVAYTTYTSTDNKVTLYALDGRTADVLENEVSSYLNVGWYKTLAETQQTLYAPDGRTTTVFLSEVPAYLNVGWYKTLAETQQTLYAPDGRTTTVFLSEVPAYLNLGWYKTNTEAYNSAHAALISKSNSTNTSASTKQTADGKVYRTKTGKKYHLDPDCGGKSSTPITLEEAKRAGLTPCSKCAS